MNFTNKNKLIFRTLGFFLILLLLSIYTSGLGSFLWRRFEPLNVTTSAQKIKEHFLRIPKSKIQPEHCFLFLHGGGTTPQQAWRNVFHAAETDNFWGKQILMAPYLDQIDGFLTYDFIQASNNVEELLKTVPQCTQWIIVGNSLGAWLGYYLAVEKSNLFKSVVGLNAVGLDRKYEFLMETLQNPSTQKMMLLHQATYHNPPQVPRWVWAIAAFGIKQSNVELMNLKSPFLLESYLPRAKQPALLIWGLSDHLIPNLQKDFLVLLPTLQTVSIEQCGHVPQEECWPEVSMILQSWLASTGS